MYIYIYIYIYLYIYIYIYVYTCTHMHTHTHTLYLSPSHTHTRTHKRICIYVHIYIYIQIYIYSFQMDNMWPLCNGPQCACKRVTAHLNKKDIRTGYANASQCLSSCMLYLSAHACAEWLVYTWHDSFIRDITHSYVILRWSEALSLPVTW